MHVEAPQKQAQTKGQRGALLLELSPVLAVNAHPHAILTTPTVHTTEKTHNGDVMAWTQSTANTKHGLLS
jgi:hypothetical protein